MNVEDNAKTREQLIAELQELRQTIKELKAAEIQQRQLTAVLDQANTIKQIIFDAVPALIWCKDTQNRYVRVNETAAKSTGLRVEDMEGKTAVDIYPHEGEAYYQHDLEVIQTGQPKLGLLEKMPTTSGEIRWMRTDRVPYYDANGKIMGVIVFSVDITELKRVEEALANEKERLDVTLRSIGDGVITTDVEGRVVLINQVTEQLTGWTQAEAAGKPLTEVFHIINELTREVCENPVEKVLKTGQIIGLANHTVLVARDGTEYVIADSGAPIRDSKGQIIGVVLVFRDITKQQKIEEELLKVEKLESIGILAGGIAHDFNNILTAIIGNISIAKLSIDPAGTAYARLVEAEKASLQAKHLTQQLLTFAKGGAPIVKTTSIVDLIKESVTFTLRGSNVRCEFIIQDDLWPVEVDEGQIGQVLNNLIINADQAMPNGGLITVKAENVFVSTDDPLPLAAGEYVRLSIKDQGIGIPQEHLPKIFDPYFTTKQKGSGLGLATSFSIIKKHDGYINVETELGKGTTFYVYLPASRKAIVQQKVSDERLDIGNRESVLVMDDEALIRDVTGQMLEIIGYVPAYACDGDEAIMLYKNALQAGCPFDAVIMDLTIPNGKGGKETIRKLREIDPNVKAIVSSGYSNDPVMANYQAYGFQAVITKPYKIKELSEILRKVLRK